LRDFLLAASAVLRGMNERSLRDALEVLVGAVAIGDAMLGPPSADCVFIGSVRFLAISVLHLMTKAARANSGLPSLGLSCLLTELFRLETASSVR
jgi:hypothetical protein